MKTPSNTPVLIPVLVAALSSLVPCGCGGSSDRGSNSVKRNTEPPNPAAAATARQSAVGALWLGLTSCDLDTSRSAALELPRQSSTVLRAATYRVVDSMTDAMECEGTVFVLDSTTARCLTDGVAAALAGLEPLQRVELALRLDDLAQGMRMAGVRQEARFPVPPDLLLRGLAIRKLAIQQLERALREIPDGEGRSARDELLARKTSIEDAADLGSQ